MMTPSTRSQHDVFGKESMGFGYNIRFIKESGLDYFAVTGLMMASPVLTPTFLPQIQH